MMKTITNLVIEYQKTRDERTFNEIYDYMEPYLRNFLKKRFHGSSHIKYIDDVMSMTMARIWEKIDQFDSSKSNFVTWAGRIAHNEFLHNVHYTLMGKRDYRKVIDKEFDIVTFQNDYDEIDYKGFDVTELYQYVKPKDKLAIDVYERYFKGERLIDIAEDMNINYATIKTLLHRTRHQMEKGLKHDIVLGKIYV